MNRLITTALCATLAMSAAAPSFAQNYAQRNETYVQDRAEYDRQMREYEVSRARFERDRAEYDRRYGAGSFERYYGTFRDTAPQYSGDRNNDRYAYDPYAPYQNSPCERRNTANTSGNRTGGTVLGALIGGALGAVAAGDSSETEGAILGAVVGGVIGNNVAGNSASRDRYTARCDANGYYYTYNQTIPYREDGRYQNGIYDARYYTRQRCRMVAAPAQLSGRTDYRYVRVCPDRNNRYRITS